MDVRKAKPSRALAASCGAGHALPRIQRQQAVLQRIGENPALISGDVEAIARQVTELASKATGAERVNAWLFNEDESELRCIDLYEATAARHSAGMVLREREFRTEFRALKSARFVAADDPLTDPRTAGYVESYLKPLRIASMLDAVIHASGRNLGLLCLEHVGRPHRWEPDEISFACQLADKIGLALFCRERRRAEERLRESEARFRSLTEMSSDYYWETDAEHRFTKHSKMGSGRSLPRVGGWLGKRRWDIPYESPGEAAWRMHREMLDAHVPFRGFELSRRDAGGEARHFSISGDPVFDDAGAFVGYRGVGSDITERRRAVAEVIEARQRLQLAIEASGAAIWDTNVSNGEVYLSEGWSRMLGGEPKVTKTSIDELTAMTHPDDLNRVIEASVEAMRGESGEFAQEHRVRTRGGQWIWVRTAGRVVARDASGRAVRMTGTNIDITRRRQEERLLALEHAVTRCLADAESIPAGLQSAMQAICESEGWDAARYFGADERSALLRIGECWTRDDVDREAFMASARELSLRRGSGVAGRVWQWGEPIWVPDIARDHRVQNRSLASESGFRSAFLFPVTAQGKVIGVFAAFSRHKRPPDERLLRAVHVIGSQLGQFLRRKEAEQRLTYLAQFDSLTGLPNRVLFQDRLAQALAQAERSQWQVGLLILDLDNFKWVNDTLGHGTGDELLRGVAGALQACVRTGDTIARLAGDEFAIVLPDVESADSARVVAQKLLDALKAPFRISAHEVCVGASIGITVYPTDATDADTLVRNADAALYKAKDAGRNGYQYFTASMNAESARQLEMEKELRLALGRGEFELQYQPKMDVALGRVTGVEALLRWRRAGELVPPSEFVPALERSGLISEVGDWVLREACRQLVAWNDAAPGAMRIAVNVSARQLRGGRLVECVKRALAESGCAPSRLELEITESLLMRDVELTVQALEVLRAMGVRIAVDDFGTGYSSLAYLKKLPVDVLKIDRSFVKDLSEDANDAAITNAIVAMARSLGYRTVAEGVETALQRQFLEGCGCDEVQGHLLSRPLAAAEFVQWLAQRGICPEK